MYLLTCLPYSFCSLHEIGLDSLTTLRMQEGEVGVWMCDVWGSIQGYGVQPGCAGLCARAPQLCPTWCDPWTVARQAPLSMGFFRQEYWNGLPCSPPGVFPTQKSNPHLWHLLHCRRVLYTLSQLGSLSNQATCGKREESHLLMFCCPDLKWLMNTASKHTEEKIMHLSWIEHKLYLSIKKSGK